MAVNHVDGTLFSTAMLCPIIGGFAALVSGAAWFTITFAATGLLLGTVLAYVGRKLVYSIVAVGIRLASPMKPMAQQLVMAPFFVLYIGLPYAISGAAILGTFFGTSWLARQIATYLNGSAEIVAGVASSILCLFAVVVFVRRSTSRTVS